MERKKLGQIDVVALVDNTAVYPSTAVYPEAGDALNQFASYFDEDGGLHMNFGCFLVVDAGQTILFDTGWGPEANGALPDELSAAGVSPEDVDIVTFTHLHGDHTGWTLDRASGQPLFPSARYLVPKGDWDHFSAVDPPADSFVRDIQPLMTAGRIDLFEGETSISPSITSLPTPGHTPGHMSFVLSSGNERGFILGDVVLGHADAELPTLANSFDSDSAVAHGTRVRTINRLAEDGSLVGASHLPAPGFGRFVMRDGKSGWTPA